MGDLEQTGIVGPEYFLTESQHQRPLRVRLCRRVSDHPAMEPPRAAAALASESFDNLRHAVSELWLRQLVDTTLHACQEDGTQQGRRGLLNVLPLFLTEWVGDT